MRRLALGIAVLGILAALLALGGLDLLRDPERVAALYTETGPWGPLVFLLLFTFLEPVGVPGVLFFVPAALVWPPAQAFLLTWLGALGAAAFGFAFARWLARDWVADRLPARFRRIDERIGERPLVSVILVRLLFFLAPPAHWVLGLSRVGFGPYLLGSAIGYLPGIALVV
ncbi:MAG: VTT domain-containing protein, partial [Myxococcota bacterium]